MFYRSIITRGVAECFYSDKTRTASFLNGFKNIPQKARLLGVQTKVQIGRENISIKKKEKKNKLCLISILSIKNTNEECFIGI